MPPPQKNWNGPQLCGPFGPGSPPAPLRPPSASATAVSACAKSTSPVSWLVRRKILARMLAMFACRPHFRPGRLGTGHLAWQPHARRASCHGASPLSSVHRSGHAVVRMLAPRHPGCAPADTATGRTVGRLGEAHAGTCAARVLFWGAGDPPREVALRRAAGVPGSVLVRGRARPAWHPGRPRRRPRHLGLLGQPSASAMHGRRHRVPRAVRYPETAGTATCRMVSVARTRGSAWQRILKKTIDRWLRS